ncbi:MAG: hypothetical protein ABI723_08640 [Bacteroidia bacterium]
MNLRPETFITVFIIVCMLCFASCFYGYKTEVTVIPENKITHDSLEYFREVELFNGTCELPDSVYIRIASLKVEGKKNTTESELAELLRQKAFKLGANAVFDIKVDQETRTRGSTLIELLTAFDKNSESSEEEYQALVITGLAVYIKY